MAPIEKGDKNENDICFPKNGTIFGEANMSFSTVFLLIKALGLLQFTVSINGFLEQNLGNK